MFKIYGDRPELWQWDTGQKLIVEDADINEVHFHDGINSIALVCEVYELEGLRVVNIPNVVLQDNCDMKVFAFVATADGSYTEHREIIKVNRRSRPVDYVYTETELKSYEVLEKQIADISKKVDNAGIGLTEEDVKNLISEEMPTMPTKLSQLENDSDFATNTYVDNALDAINEEMPTKLSQLENDSNFVNKDYVDNILGAINAELATLTEVAE